MKIYIERSLHEGAINIYVRYERDGKVYEASPQKLEFHEITSGQISTPTYQFPINYTHDGESFLTAMAEALMEFGVLKKIDAPEIEAIKFHLEDMRRLVFEKKETS